MSTYHILTPRHCPWNYTFLRVQICLKCKIISVCKFPYWLYKLLYKRSTLAVHTISKQPLHHVPITNCFAPSIFFLFSALSRPLKLVMVVRCIAISNTSNMNLMTSNERLVCYYKEARDVLINHSDCCREHPLTKMYIRVLMSLRPWAKLKCKTPNQTSFRAVYLFMMCHYLCRLVVVMMWFFSHF